MVKLTAPKVKSSNQKKQSELEKVEQMMKSRLDIKKSEQENNETPLPTSYKIFSKINNFLSIEFFANFMMAI